MQEPMYPESQCLICGNVRRKWSHQRTFYCDLHKRDEVEFHDSLPERSRMTKDMKAQERLYAKRWQGKTDDVASRIESKEAPNAE